MKNTIKLATLLLLVSFTFTSCDDDDIKSLADVEVESSLDGTYNLNFKADSEEEVNESMTLSLSDNSDISEYINELKALKITKITYEITEFTGSQYVQMYVGYYMNGDTIVAPMVYNLDSESSVEYSITDTDILSSISTTLLNNKAVIFELKGDYQSLEDATAELTVTVYFEATANPL